jgi:cytoplasmic iron level regulating protein YaaA (DUF328/UPF0246 family)
MEQTSEEQTSMEQTSMEQTSIKPSGKRRKEMENEKLTPEQVENWRNFLVTLVGLYALLLTAEQIQAYRDSMQKNINQGKY